MDERQSWDDRPRSLDEPAVGGVEHLGQTRADPDDAPGFFTDHHESHAQPRRRRGLASCLVVVVVLGALGAGAVFAVVAGVDQVRDLFAGPEDYSGDGSGSVVFEVRQGDTSADIGRNLEASGVVASIEAFTDAAAENPDSRGIQVGFYELKERMSAESALDVLIEPDNLVQNTVTVPEGLRVEDTLKRIADETKVPMKELQQAVRRSAAIGLPSYAEGNAEGYLFPATYAFAPNADAVDMLSMMVDRWRQAAEETDLESRADELGYSPGELMIVASLVEAEANRDQDRGKVARVIYNRLESDATDGLLQIDATVNYALGRDLGLGLSQQDLKVDSPYNTRKYPGLPPGPIESPGAEAIDAAANPTEGDWIYYVTVNLDTGETRFSEEYRDFLADKRVLDRYCDGSDRC